MERIAVNKDEKEKKLKEIAHKIGTCQKCSLYQSATNSVPGAGNPSAKVVFIGEAPGYHEDQQGLPFVGAAGKFLDKLLLSIKLNREEVWIGNILKHRPPGNRDPRPDEVKACVFFLNKQIEIIDPRLIVTLGRFAMEHFLPEEKISRIHGQARYVNFAGKKRILLPIYHPAAGLRNGRILEETKKDFQKIPQFLEEQPRAEDIPFVSKEKDEQMGLF